MAHCAICEAMGYGECERCGNPTFDGGPLCGYCLDEDQGDELVDERRKR